MKSQFFFRWLSTLLFVGITLTTGTRAADNPSPKKSKESAKTESPYKPWGEVTKDAQEFKGLFDLYLTKEGNIYMAIDPNQLDTFFQITMQLSRGIGDAGVLAGSPLDDYAFEFHRVDSEVQFIKKNTAFKAAPDSPLSRSVKRDFSDSVLASLKILSIEETKKSILVDAGDLFLADLPNVARLLSTSLEGHYAPEASKTYTQTVQAFPQNVEVEVNADFGTSAPPKDAAFLDTIPDWRNILLGVHYSLSSLPGEPYQPRLSDDRIGYFTTDAKDFSSRKTEPPIVRYINRWNLAKKPVVFWIENTTPVRFRNAVKEAVLEWNKAFAKIGIENALDVKVQPDDASWNPSDIRYNVIHWIAPSESKFAGVGPSHTNPLTGEIYNASVSIDNESIRRVEYIYDYELSLLPGKTSRSANTRMTCLFPTLSVPEAELGALGLWLSSSIPDGFKVPESFVEDYVKELVMHEVGHCLGLRHNFHGSSYLSIKDLNNPSITRNTGLSASIMDYLPINLAPPGETQGDYFSHTIGTYDEWAIQYGYMPAQGSTPEEDKKGLEPIASQSKQPGHVYATDEDSNSPYHLDPYAMTFDLSNDSLGFTENRLQNYHHFWKLIPEKLPRPGKSYAQARRAFDLVFSGYTSYAPIAAQFIGGQFFDRTHRPLSGASALPFTLIPKKEQLRALEILDRGVFNEQAFSFPPETLNRLAPDRNVDRFSDLQPFITPFAYPILEKIGDIQGAMLKQFFRPVLLRRLLNNEKKVSNPKDTLTLADFFGWMTRSFWSELGTQGHIGASRRNLQRTHLSHLVEIAVHPKPQTFGIPELEIPPIPIATVPEDARSQAEFELEQIRSKIVRALAARESGMDRATRSHLHSCVRLIDRTLRATVNEPVGGDTPPPQDQE